MFKQVQQIVAAAVCAVALIGAAAPACAQSPTVFTARAGTVQSIDGNADDATLRAIAAELEGLIHQIAVDPTTEELTWTVWTRDNVKTILTAPAYLDTEFKELWAIARFDAGPLAGAKVDVTGYKDGERLMMDGFVTNGRVDLWFTQELTLLEGTLPL